ncbi:MAG: hypothetical protein QOF89_5629 [Acidobacteriota bacterium]|nr:hypothetical protein [Acidobacteriota bacterium]
MTIRSHRTSIAGAASRFAIIFSLLFAGAGRSGAQWVRVSPAPPGKSLRVLFIGNSLTSANDLPLMVQALAKAAGKTLYVESVILGGANLEDHWNDGGALRAITSKRWSVVVLQQGPSSLPESRVHLRTWTQKFAGPIRQAGGRPALYMVWPELERSAFFDDVRDSYSLAASDVNGLFFPAGEAFRAAWRRDPKAPLFSSDGFHPTVAGTYAAALSIYGVLYRRDPEGLPARLELANGQAVTIPQALATLLQDAATEANQTYGRP